MKDPALQVMHGEGAGPYAHWSRQDLEQAMDEKSRRLESIQDSYNRLHAVMTLAENGAAADHEPEVIDWARDVAVLLLAELGGHVIGQAPAQARAATR